MSAHDPKHKVFSHFSLASSSELPAPYFFERFNFNPFEIFGWYRSFKLNNDSKTFVYSKHIIKHANVDEYQRLINSQGFLINDKGAIVDQTGRVVFDKKQLQDGCLQTMFTFSGALFSIHDVMGCLLMNEAFEIQLLESKKYPGKH